MIRSFIAAGIRNRNNLNIFNAYFSSWGKGQDLLGDALDSAGKPKIILDGYSTSGFDVVNIIEKIVKEDDTGDETGAVHMTGSILAFPHACFLWKVNSIEDVSLDTLAPTILHRPKLNYVFIGSDIPMDPQKLEHLKTEMREKAGIVLEQLSIGNAMGTFNILNGEDRTVAAAFILPPEEDEDKNIDDEKIRKQ